MSQNIKDKNLTINQNSTCVFEKHIGIEYVTKCYDELIKTTNPELLDLLRLIPYSDQKIKKYQKIFSPVLL